jgi:Cu/Ag efflux protein CusF
MLTKQLADYKLYVLNNLVQIVHDTESNQKEKIAALRSIGEIDGVDAFKKKTEITHKHETMEEVETELLAMLSELKQKAVLKPKSQTVDAEFTMSQKEPVSGREEIKDN